MARVKQASQTLIIKLTAAIVLGGTIRRSGELIEVTEAEAKNLLHRGKAVLAEATDAPPADNLANDTDTDLDKQTKAELNVKGKEDGAMKSPIAKRKPVQQAE